MATQQSSQVIRTYRGKHIQRDFQREADYYAQQNWYVTSQATGGAKRPGCLSVLAFGALARGKGADTLVVTYRYQAPQVVDPSH